MEHSLLTAAVDKLKDDEEHHSEDDDSNDNNGEDPHPITLMGYFC